MNTGVSKYDEITTSEEIDESLSSGKRTKTAEKHITTVVHRSRWEWLQLLILPLVLTFSVVFFNSQEQVRSEQSANVQHASDQQLQREQFANSQQLQQNQQYQATLETYLDHMSGLIPALHASTREDDPIRITAQAQTLAALLQLDTPRKRIVVMFLYQANLINVKRDNLEIFHPDPPTTILHLNSADLSGVDLHGDDLHGISLGGVNLSGAILNGTLLYESNLYQAHLSKAKLKGVNLNGSFLDSADLSSADLTNAKVQADFYRADLSGADLSGADLGNANLKGADLSGADLSGAILTGAKYNNIAIHQGINDLKPTRWALTDQDAQRGGAILDNTLTRS